MPHTHGLPLHHTTCGQHGDGPIPFGRKQGKARGGGANNKKGSPDLPLHHLLGQLGVGGVEGVVAVHHGIQDDACGVVCVWWVCGGGGGWGGGGGHVCVCVCGGRWTGISRQEHTVNGRQACHHGTQDDVCGVGGTAAQPEQNWEACIREGWQTGAFATTPQRSPKRAPGAQAAAAAVATHRSSTRPPSLRRISS